MHYKCLKTIKNASINNAAKQAKAGNNCRGKWLMVKKIPAITLVLWATPKQPPVKKLTAVLFQVTERR
jgi:hypothetical protein